MKEYKRVNNGQKTKTAYKNKQPKEAKQGPMNKKKDPI